MNPPLPIIRIEVETMKQTMLHAFSEQLVQLDEMFKVALEDACDPIKVQTLLTDAANKYMSDSIQEEVSRYFRHGEGRNIVQQKVHESLKRATEGMKVEV